MFEVQICYQSLLIKLWTLPLLLHLIVERLLSLRFTLVSQGLSVPASRLLLSGGNFQLTPHSVRST